MNSRHVWFLERGYYEKNYKSLPKSDTETAMTRCCGGFYVFSPQPLQIEGWHVLEIFEDLFYLYNFQVRNLYTFEIL